MDISVIIGLKELSFIVEILRERERDLCFQLRQLTYGACSAEFLARPVDKWKSIVTFSPRVSHLSHKLSHSGVAVRGKITSTESTASMKSLKRTMGIFTPLVYVDYSYSLLPSCLDHFLFG